MILNWTNTDNIQWKRTSAEGFAIVISILLAFWIDTWWEDRKEARFSCRLENSKLPESQQIDCFDKMALEAVGYFAI